MPRVLAATLAVLLAACSSPTVSPRSSPGPQTELPSPAASAEPPEITPTPVPAPDQAETPWGPIWLALPSGFPEPPGGERAEPEDGFASAAYRVSTRFFPYAMELAGFYGGVFTAAGFVANRDGPQEDGSYTVPAGLPNGCDALVTLVPRGEEEVFVTVYYGAGCPFRWPV